MLRRKFAESGVGVGLGLMAANSLIAESSPYGAKQVQFNPRAKRVIHICALGGMSHVDTFDYKPELAKRHGEEYKADDYDPFFGKPGKLLKSPFEFAQHGESGRWVSSLFPHVATCADELTFVYSMHSKNSNHTPATFLENTGFSFNGFPGLGAWVSYGLGSENHDLPAFVVLPDPRGLPAGGSINWSSGFLPAVHQGVAFRPEGEPISDLQTPKRIAPEARRAAAGLLRNLNRGFADAHPTESAFEARIRAYELAAKMQMSVPDLVDVDKHETAATKRLYGLENEASAGFGRNCLLARRLCERGVRFVQLFNGGAFGGRPRKNWDAHEDIVLNHGNQAATLDHPVAGLIKDLKSRGMLEETIVLVTSEFGRTPATEGLGGKGRDHHPDAFTVWMAGGGFKPGMGFGSSDELGFKAADQPKEFYDIHATLLHLLGMNHEELTFYHNGIQRRLTDVHGKVIHEILA
ncbi:MAG: hypothetical protein ACI8UO_004000 [Verrucomicrobiales bacterium]|jgi:hypothetical protein